MAKNKAYQYQEADNLLSLADQFQTSPQQIIQANQGGYPFTNGQIINIPQAQLDMRGRGFQFPSTPTSPFNSGQVLIGSQWIGGSQPLIQSSPLAELVKQRQRPNTLKSGGNAYEGNTPFGINLTPNLPAMPNSQSYNVNQRGRGAGGPPQDPYSLQVASQIRPEQFSGLSRTIEAQQALTSTTPPPVVSAYAMQSLGIDPVANGYTLENGMWRLNPTAAASVTGEGDFYGYKRNPETGRDERVVMNAANGDSFLNQKRYDPQTKKYVSIGKLLKQGKLDLQGRTRRQSKRDRLNANAAKQEPAPEPVHMTGFGLVSFGAGSG